MSFVLGENVIQYAGNEREMSGKISNHIKAGKLQVHG